MSLLYRVKCPFCGKVEDLPDSGPCRKCRNPIQLPGDGIIHIYRSHEALGVGYRMYLFLNGIHLGYLGFGESIRIPVQYGHYSVVMRYPEKGLRRPTGIPFEFDITPDNRVICLKAYTRPGYMTNTTYLEQSSLEQMPPL